MDSFFQLVYKAVKSIPRGKVATYGQIAAMCGAPKNARAVGYALHVNPEPDIIPCHRVVNRHGRTAPAFAFGGSGKQQELLEAEGIEFTQNQLVNMAKYLWEET